jgi:aspartyl-tRNA(Asn)/glutamyl-tRNA(Gln) amidotransferase subunit A
MIPDLHATRTRLLRGETTAEREIEHCIERAQSPACQPAFIRTRFTAARTEARLASPDSPLAGLALSVKDLFDAAGEPTPAGSVVLRDAPPAQADAPALARLRAAGGVSLGRTHMVEFAFSGMGTNPHYPPLMAWNASPNGPGWQDGEARVPGGSSSGAAVSVASGAAYIGLGSDTGGSIRIPAALNGIVGFKSTACRVPITGALPLSPTLDTVCALTRSVRDAVLAHEILAARTVNRGNAPISDYRLAVVRTTLLDELDPEVAHAFERSLGRLSAAGAHIAEIDLRPVQDLAGLQATGGFAAAESYAWHRRWLERAGEQYDPRVAARIRRGAAMKAHEYLELVVARTDWMARVDTALSSFDAVLSPTVPIVAPRLADVAPGEERDDAFFRANALLLRNTSVVNMLDGCAISIPCQAPGELPVGLMIWHGAWRDDAVLAFATQAEAALAQRT